MLYPLLKHCITKGCSPCENPEKYEKAELDYVRLCLDKRFGAQHDHLRARRIPTIVDIGAHVGLWSLHLAEHCTQSLGVVPCILAIEPDPANFAALEYNKKPVESGVYGINGACWDHTEELWLHHGLHAGGYYTKPGVSGKGVSVVAYPLDKMMINNFMPMPVDVMKLDVEGAELNTLVGAQGTISQSPNMLLCVEYSIGNYRRFNATPAQVTEFLTNRGFVIPRKQDRAALKAIKPAQILRIFFAKGEGIVYV